MTIERLLYSYKPDFLSFVNSLNRKFRPKNKKDFLNYYKGKVAELYVNFWLENCPEIQIVNESNFPKINNLYFYEIYGNFNILFYKNEKLLFEVDNIFKYNDIIFPV